MAENKKLLMYKGKPLVRKDNTLYYGYMDEPCIIMMQITSTKDVNGAELSDKILVQLVSTDEDLRPRDRILKKAERRGLYSAIAVRYGLSASFRKEHNERRSTVFVPRFLLWQKQVYALARWPKSNKAKLQKQLSFYH